MERFATAKGNLCPRGFWCSLGGYRTLNSTHGRNSAGSSLVCPKYPVPSAPILLASYAPRAFWNLLRTQLVVQLRCVTTNGGASELDWRQNWSDQCRCTPHAHEEFHSRKKSDANFKVEPRRVFQLDMMLLLLMEQISSQHGQ